MTLSYHPIGMFNGKIPKKEQFFQSLRPAAKSSKRCHSCNSIDTVIIF